MPRRQINISAPSIPPPLPELLLLPPPYTRLVEPPAPSDLDLQPRNFAAGTLLALRLRGTETTQASLRYWAPQLRARLPALPLVLLLDAPVTATLFSLAQVAGELHARAILSDAERSPSSLRAMLTRPGDLGAEVEEWLGIYGLPLPPKLGTVAREMFRSALRHRSLAHLLGGLGEASSTVRARFGKHDLPSPSKWFQAAQALQSALNLQRQPDRSVLRTALELGYADHSALCHQFARVFRIGPAAVRNRLGWEWLLDRWLTLHLPTARRELAPL